MKKSRIAFMAILMAMIMVTTTVLAVTGSLIDTTKKGSLTITALEQENGSTATTGLSGLEGVEYSLYLVADTVTTNAAAETAITGATATQVKTTSSTGVAKFENLNLGRYYAKVTAIPEGTSEVPASFLVDIPRTNAAGTGWTYDVEAFPKVKTANGSFTVEKTGEEGALEGAKFQLQYKTTGDWTNLGDELTTNAQGKVLYESLPSTMEGEIVTYRVIETSAPDGYIVDNSNLDQVTIEATGAVKINGIVGDTIYVRNFNPEVEKKVSINGAAAADTVNAGMDDELTFKITTDIPENVTKLKTYKVTDTLPAGLKAITASDVDVKFVITGTATMDASGNVTVSVTGNKLEVILNTASMEMFEGIPEALQITYTTKLNPETAELTNVNTVAFDYSKTTEPDETNNWTDDDDAEVTTGSLKIKKVDTASAPLQGAKFKIATTKEYAEAGTFMKTADGADIEVTSGADGYATINALADGEYYLVETESPTYVDDNGETQHYLLLSSPKKVTVNGETEVEVVNKKQTLLPLTGGIGSALFVIAGSALVIVSKKMKKEEE